MKKNKKIKIAVVTIIMIVGFLSVLLSIDKYTFKKPSFENRSVIAMYVEGDDGYELSEDNTFPTDGYVLNTSKSSCANGGVLSQDSVTKAIKLSVSHPDRCTVYFDKAVAVVLLDSLVSKANATNVTTYSEGNTGEMYYFTHSGGEPADYRYIGKTPNNYIKFNNETWRILGVFPSDINNASSQKLVKIVRDDSIGKAAWDTAGTNNWSKSSLRTLLNSGDYYNRTGSYASTGLTSVARSQIVSTKWYLGGTNSFAGQGAESYYGSERGSSLYVSETFDSIDEKVGLMYASEYAYTFANGIDTTCFTDTFSCNKSTGEESASWFYKASSQSWVMTPIPNQAGLVFFVNSPGDMGFNVSSTELDVYPSLYLSPDIKVTGSGTQSDPYIVEEPKCVEQEGELESSGQMQSGYRVTYPVASSYTLDQETGKFSLNTSSSVYWMDVQVGQYIATANTNAISLGTSNLSSVCRVESTDNNTITCRTITAACK